MIDDIPRARAVNRGLADLRRAALAPRPLDEAPLAEGLRFRIDPEAGFEGEIRSPAGRIAELSARPATPGRWFGLHLGLPDMGEIADLGWFGFVLRTAADRPVALRPCLRSGRPEGGFTDLFFARHALARPGATDHHDMIAPARVPDLAAPAPWREFILFLPAGEPLDLSIEDLGIIAL
jgi:hypothetical protein